MKTQAFLEHMLWLRVVVLLIQRLRLIRLIVWVLLIPDAGNGNSFLELHRRDKNTGTVTG